MVSVYQWTLFSRSPVCITQDMFYKDLPTGVQLQLRSCLTDAFSFAEEKAFTFCKKKAIPLFLQSNIYMWVKVYEFKYILLHLFEIFVVLVTYFPWVYFQVFWLLTLIIYFFLQHAEFWWSCEQPHSLMWSSLSFLDMFHW